MAQESCVEPIVCLRWVTERPHVDGSRRSPIFSILQNQFYLVMSLYQKILTVRDIFSCDINLIPVPPSSFAFDQDTECQLRVGDAVWYHSVRLKGRYKLFSIFSKNMEKDEVLRSVKVEKWTVQCEFKGLGSTESFSLQVGNKRVKMSVGNDSSPAGSADECVQVSQEVPRDMEALSSDISRLLEDRILPDFELKCGGRVFPVHKSVLAARSEVFRAMLQNRMAENESGSADIKDVEPGVLESLLKFLYSGKFADPTDDDVISGLYEASDKYAVRSLSAACSYWMVRNMSEDNCLDYLKDADSHSDLELRRAAIAFIRDNPGIFKNEAWSTFSKEHLSLAYEVLHTYATS